MFSIVSLLVVLPLSILVTRIATVALTHTGLSRQSARFQARSAFTGVGFTTNESEKVVNHPIRRRILLLLMLLGNAGVVTAVSSLILSFVNLNQTGSSGLLWQIVLLVSGLVLLWSLAASSWVDRHLSNLVSKALKRYTRLRVQDYAKLLHLAGDYQITELQVEKDDWLAEQALSGLDLRQEGILVLGVTRSDGRYIGAPDGDTIVRTGDTLILYGRAGCMAELDQRQSGSKGNMAHRRGVADQQHIEQREKEKNGG
jgi:K+/H+ antiporter YhaU regulatory subunit KhtT